MTKEAGSYTFEADPSMKVELDRLKKQATMAAPIERQILQATGLQKGMTAMDVGCGPGFVSIEIAKIVGEQGHVLGVDISDTLLRTATAYAAEVGITNTSFLSGSVYNLSVAAASCDYAYARFFVQHLERPLDALQQISQTIKPGGRICLVDVDDQWLTLYPEPEAFEDYNQRAIQGQKASGGDRYIGRKLGYYLQEAGFINPRIQIIPVTSSDIGMDAFMEIAISPRWKMLPEAERAEGQKQYQRFREEMTQSPKAWGMLALFVASADKAI